MAHAEEERKALGLELAQARKIAGFTLEGAAAELTSRGFPIGKQAIGAWEKGRNLPDALWLRRLARLYELSLDSLVGEAPSTPTAALARAIDSIEDPDQRADVLRLCHGLVSLQLKQSNRTDDLDQARQRKV